MVVSRQFVKCSSFITLFLPCLTIATTNFIKTPSNTVKYVGDDVVLNWTYVAPSKDKDFGNLSPIWNYYYPNGTNMVQLAGENKNNGWKWEISNSCPPRLRYPVQRIFKSKPGDQFSASLTITNLTLADSGKYECRLEMRFHLPVVDKITLTVAEAPPVTPSKPELFYFTTTPKDEEKFVGQDIVMNWTYDISAPSKDTVFARFSPVWNYYDENDKMCPLAQEDKNNGWKWDISNSACLNDPGQRIFKSKPGDQFSASLTIKDLTLADSGKYECVLKGHSSQVNNTMTLQVRVRPPGGLGTWSIIGIIIGVLAAIIIIGVIIRWLVKRKNNAKKGQRIPMSEN